VIPLAHEEPQVWVVNKQMFYKVKMKKSLKKKISPYERPEPMSHKV